MGDRTWWEGGSEGPQPRWARTNRALSGPARPACPEPANGSERQRPEDSSSAPRSPPTPPSHPRPGPLHLHHIPARPRATWAAREEVSKNWSATWSRRACGLPAPARARNGDGETQSLPRERTARSDFWARPWLGHWAVPHRGRDSLKSFHPDVTLPLHPRSLLFRGANVLITCLQGTVARPAPKPSWSH